MMSLNKTARSRLLPLTSFRWYPYLAVFLFLFVGQIASGATVTPSSNVYVDVYDVTTSVYLGPLDGRTLKGRLAEVGDTKPDDPLFPRLFWWLEFFSPPKSGYSLEVDFSRDSVVESTLQSIRVTIDGVNVFKSNVGDRSKGPLKKLWESVFGVRKKERIYAYFRFPFSPIHTKSNNTNARQLHTFRVTAYKSNNGKGEVLGLRDMQFYTVPANTTR